MSYGKIKLFGGSIAHRGGVVDSTNVENSLPALTAAIKNRYRMVEMDMRLTKDSVLIIQHDRDFKRYYGVDSNASDMSCTRQQLEENRHKPGYKSSDYYLFGGVKSMTSEDVLWVGQQGIMVVGAVNMFSYREGGLGAAFKDIETLKSWGVRRFQVDSEMKKGF